MNNKCAWCRGEVSYGHRRTLALDKLGAPKRAKRNSKTFYHLACVTWKRRETERWREWRLRRGRFIMDLTKLLKGYEDCKLGSKQAVEIFRFIESKGVNI